MRLAEGKSGTLAEGNALVLYWLVDKDDGIIVDARFQVYGQSVLIGAAETTCDLLIGKNYDQAKRIGQSSVKVKRTPHEITITVPLKLLGHPDRILTSARTFLGNIPLDNASWLAVELN